MKSNKLNELVKDFIEGIKDIYISLDDLEMSIENEMYKIEPEFIEDEEGEEIENPVYKESIEYVYNKVKNSNELQKFIYGSYAHDGKIKTLNETILCNKKFNNPFDAMAEEI